MRHALADRQWKELMPDAYHWLGQAKFANGKGEVDDAHHIVVVNTKGADAGQFQIDAPALSEATIAELKKQAQDLGWCPKAGPTQVRVSDKFFSLVPLQNVRTSTKQLARQVGLDAAQAVRELSLGKLAFCRTSTGTTLDVFEGYVAGVYNHVAFKGKRESRNLPADVVFAGDQHDDFAIKKSVQISRASLFSRFLQDAPANYINPIKLSEIAQDMAREFNLRCTILDKVKMQGLGMEALLSVSDGGPTDPRTIIVEIEGDDNSRTVALVGKGLTFDSGGISIKPSLAMDEMKYDMSGGAAVLGAAHFLGNIKPPVKVVCLVGASENMPSGTATKPGDIVKAYNGKSIEILNTDAEGRLVLADVLAYAVKNFEPNLIVDAATLTGAVLHALGSAGSAVMANDEHTAGYIKRVAAAAGEPFWQLPLWPELDKEVKGEVADLRNIAKPNVKAGTITAGVFLREFVGKHKWAHLDIAATAWSCQACGYPDQGGSAFGLRTLAEAALNFNE